MIRHGSFAAALIAATLTPSTALAVASAELYRTQATFYGRYDARIRYAAADGVISSFFLWKVGSEMSGAYWNELDFEKLGADCHVQTNALYGAPVNSSEESHTTPSDPCDAYHDYRFEWTPEYIAWFVDGREIRRDTGAVATAFAQNATAGMRIHFNVWPGNANFGGNFNPASLPVRQYISNVQYSSYQNGNFVVAWREEFDGPSLPSGWAVGNWASPYALSTHNAANVSFVNGIAVLSLTADDATGYTGVPPADPGSTGGAGGAGAGGAVTGGMATGGVTMGGSTTGGGTMGGSSTGGATVGGFDRRRRRRYLHVGSERDAIDGRCGDCGCRRRRWRDSFWRQRDERRRGKRWRRDASTGRSTELRVRLSRGGPTRGLTRCSRVRARCARTRAKPPVSPQPARSSNAP